MGTLSNATDNMLVIFASTEYVERTGFTVLVVSDGKYITDELVFPQSLGALYTMRKISELAKIYGQYANLVELQTDITELIRLAATTAGVHVRPKRRKELEQYTKRTIQTYAADDIIYEIYDIAPMEEPPKRSKLHEWIIGVLKTALNKLEGER